MLEAKELAIAYGKNKILSGVNLQIPKGCSTAIMGRNGSGKSTLLKALSGIQKVSAGSVLFDGQPVASAHKSIGYVPQEDIAFDDLTVADNLYFWAEANGVPRANAFKSPVVQILNIEAFARKRAGALSGGMRKKLCIASAIIHDPEMLILDEPFSGIDIVAKQEMVAYLKKLQGEGKTLVLISHDVSELAALCKSFYFIKNGSLVQTTANSVDLLTRELALL